jgi:hypothetical protein
LEVAPTVTVIYRIYFASPAAMSVARRNLEAQGFFVEDAPPEESATSGQALDAALETAAGESDASSRLDAALLTIEHDPVIEYQVQRLEPFTD